MRPFLLAAALLLPACFAPPASAQPATAEGVLGQMMALVHYQAQCNIQTTPAQEATLTQVGKDMQKKSGLSDEVLGAAFKDVTAALPETDCKAFTAMFPGEIDSLKATAAKVP